MLDFGVYFDLQDDIRAFEAWQQTPDEDETFSAIHVALLLSQEPPCRNPLQ